MKLFGTETPQDLSGRSLFSEGDENLNGKAYFVTFPEQSTVPRAGLARNGYKFVMTFAENEVIQELVRLESDTKNLIESEPLIACELQAEVNGLRALGYVSE